MDEFQLIERYFAKARCAEGAAGIALGIGDDCALVEGFADQRLAVSTDTLVAGVHFPEVCSGFLLGQRALAVTASDLAAMGAEPLGFTLAITLPEADAEWLAGFVQGLDAMAAKCGLTLLGGDTCRGPLSLTLTVLGRLPAGRALLRSGAQPGDLVCVGGTLGEAAAALEVLLHGASAPAPLGERLLQRYWAPDPQFALGRLLLGRATAALDVSDGLLADLGHLARASQVALQLEAERIPVPADLADWLGAETALQLALWGGDDYRLAFSLPAAQWPQVQALYPHVCCIGRVEAGEPVVRLLDASGREKTLARTGYRHAWPGV